jgi:hypothetical protein
MESGEGGGVKHSSSCSFFLSLFLSSSVFHDCSSSCGRGGGLYVDISKQDLSMLNLALLSFHSNSAKTGKDLFLFCFSLPFLVSSSVLNFAVKAEGKT